MWYLQNQPSGDYVRGFDGWVRYGFRGEALAFDTHRAAVEYLDSIHRTAPHATFYLRPVLVPVA